MPLPRSLITLVAIVAALATIGAADLSTAASAERPPARTRLATLAQKKSVTPSRRHSSKRRNLSRRPGKHGLADAVGLTSSTRSHPQPQPSTAGLLFDGAHLSDFGLLQEAPGAIQEVPDPAGSGETSFQMTVNDHDVAPITPTDNPRAQALSPPIINEGDEFWLQTKFMLPPDFPSVKGWMSLVSIYGAPFNGSSPWQIEVANNEIRWERNGSYHYDIPWRMPVIKGSWVSVLLHERFATDGWVEMWIDGQPVSFFGREQRLAMKTMDSSNDQGANSAKIMQYREAGMFESAVVDFGPLKLGTSRESVGG
jgi:Polysaccharide lyase